MPSGSCVQWNRGSDTWSMRWSRVVLRSRRCAWLSLRLGNHFMTRMGRAVHAPFALLPRLGPGEADLRTERGLTSPRCRGVNLGIYGAGKRSSWSGDQALRQVADVHVVPLHRVAQERERLLRRAATTPSMTYAATRGLGWTRPIGGSRPVTRSTAHIGTPLCQGVGRSRRCDGAPVFVLVKQTALDVVCGSARFEGAGIGPGNACLAGRGRAYRRR
jgi:hypothetical protein